VSTISANFMTRVRELGQVWTVDELVVDADRRTAVLEFTRFDGKGRIVRGLELYVFEPTSLRIVEIRPYFASPFQAELPRQELQDFDYAGRGYPMARPA
jgi:hypothetical protein